MYEENTVEKDRTIMLLKEVMRQTGMDEAELCRKARQAPDWMERLRRKEEEATLQDCFALASALDLSLYEFFLGFDEDGRNKTCQMMK